MPVPTFALGSTYSITTHAPAVLGASYEGLVYEGGPVSYDTARLHDPKISISHAKVLPNLDSALVSADPAKQAYHIFKNPASPSMKVIFAHSWILSAVLKQAVNVTASITLTSGDMLTQNALRSILASHPSVITSFTISDPV